MCNLESSRLVLTLQWRWGTHGYAVRLEGNHGRDSQLKSETGSLLLEGRERRTDRSLESGR